MQLDNFYRFYIGKRDKLAIAICHYRFLYPALFIFITLFEYIFDSKTSVIFSQIGLSLLYVIYLVINIKIKYCERHSHVKHRIISVNIDFIYISLAFLFLTRIYNSLFLLFLIPVISALNFPSYRHYFFCASCALVYITVIQGVLVFENFNFPILIINLITYSLVFYTIAAIIYLFDKQRAAIERYTEKVKIFHQEVKLSDPYSKTLYNVLSLLKDVTKVNLITLSFIDKPKNEIYVAESVGFVNKQKAFRQSVKKGLIGVSFKTGEKIIVQDVSKDPRYLPVNESTKSELVIPVKFDGEPIGVLNFESDQLYFFDVTLVRVIEVLHEHVVAFLRNAFEVYQKELKIKEKIDEYRESSLFVRQMAHEMRNGLHNFIQLPHYLKKMEEKERDWDKYLVYKLADDQLEGLKKFQKALNNAIENRDIYTPDIKKVRIGDIFEEIDNLIYLELIKNSIDYQDKSDGEVDENEMWTDMDYVVSIVTNILLNSTNAYRKMSDSIQDRIRFNTIKLTRRLNEYNELLIEVNDLAGGIDQSLARKMSDPSVHTAGNRTGLNIIKRYVNALNGKIEYTVIKYGNRKGTKVLLRLPVKRSQYKEDYGCR